MEQIKHSTQRLVSEKCSLNQYIICPRFGDHLNVRDEINDFDLFVLINDDNKVVFFHSDVSMLSPDGLTVIGLKDEFGLHKKLTDWWANQDELTGFISDGENIIQLKAGISDLRARSVKMINRKHAEFLKQLTGGASTEERETWTTKANAAHTFLDGTIAAEDLEMLTLEVDGTETTVAELATKIVAKSQQYKRLVGMASALKNKGTKLVHASTDHSQIENIEKGLQIDVNEAVAKFKGDT